MDRDDRDKDDDRIHLESSLNQNIPGNVAFEFNMTEIMTHGSFMTITTRFDGFNGVCYGYRLIREYEEL